MLCMQFLPLQVSEWRCLKVKVHWRVTHELVYLYHLKTVLPTGCHFWLLQHCWVESHCPQAAVVLAAAFRCKNKDLPIGLLHVHVRMWLAGNETKECTIYCKLQLNVYWKQSRFKYNKIFLNNYRPSSPWSTSTLYPIASNVFSAGGNLTWLDNFIMTYFLKVHGGVGWGGVVLSFFLLKIAWSYLVFGAP